MKLQELANHAQKAKCKQRLLDSLVFKSMELRYSKISGAHTNTFNWIFDRNTSNAARISPLKEWFQSGSGVFWIAGKARSGKSTLMKYLHDHNLVRKPLRPWTGDKRLVTAGFFFWNAGTELQHSQEGLLQSMLFEVLRQCPALIEQACRKRWQSKHLFAIAEPWTRDELIETFRTIVTLSAVDTKFCFFIDGLGGCSGHHRELVDFSRRFLILRSLSSAYRADRGTFSKKHSVDQNRDIYSSRSSPRTIFELMSGICLKRMSLSGLSRNGTVDTKIWSTK